MLCPTIRAECWGKDCVRWDKAHGKCGYQADREAAENTRKINEKIFAEMTKAGKGYAQVLGYYQLLWKISLAQLIRDPTIPQELKDALQQASDAETAEKLLKDAGIL